MDKTKKMPISISYGVFKTQASEFLVPIYTLTYPVQTLMTFVLSGNKMEMLSDILMLYLAIFPSLFLWIGI